MPSEESAGRTLRCPKCGAKPDTYHVPNSQIIQFYCSEAPHAWAVDVDEIDEFTGDHLADEYNGPTWADRIRGSIPI